MKKFDVIQAWLDNVAYSHSKSQGTQYKYRRDLELFSTFIEKTPQEILDDYEALDDRQFRRKYASLLRAYISYCMNNGFAVGTVSVMVASVKSFFKYNDLPLGHVPTSRNKVTYHNRDITKDEIIMVLDASKPRDKAFYCMMAQSGLRPATQCQLRLKHVQPDFDNEAAPCKVDVPQEIAKGQYKSYFTFIGEESLKYLKAYLSTRPGISSESYLFTSYGSEKPLNEKSITALFRRTIDKLKKKGLLTFKDRQQGKPGELRLYNLRKFFRKMSHQAGFEIVQFWMGHVVTQGEEEHYRPADVEWHRKLYVEMAMPYLRFEKATPSETEQTIMELRKTVAELNRKLKERDPLLADIEYLSRLPGGKEFFSSIVKDARAKLREMVKQQKP